MRRTRGSTFELPRRPEEGRLFAGVCAGVSTAFDLDVMLVRLAFLVLTLAWGGGLLFYLLLFVTLPDERMRGSFGPSEVVRSNWRHVSGLTRTLPGRFQRTWHLRSTGRAWPRPLDRRFLALGLLAAGTLLVMRSAGAFEWLTPIRGLGLAMAILGLSALVRLHGDTR